MMHFDPSQLRVLGLDLDAHARVLGAPGTGKTTMLIETFARVIERSGSPGMERSDGPDPDVLVLAAERLVAADLRSKIESRVQRALGGTPVRTPVSFAFSLVSRAAAQVGVTPPRLLTGTVHDEAIARAVDLHLETGAERPILEPEVLRSAAFRVELRELDRILDDYDLDPAVFSARLAQLRGAADAIVFTELPAEQLRERWSLCLAVVENARALLAEDRPEELSAAALLRQARAEIASGAVVPRLILVDDAQELGEGQLGILAACAAAGSSVWLFGDPDMTTTTFRGERVRALSNLSEELRRRSRGMRAPEDYRFVSDDAQEQRVVLSTVHRHGAGLRGLVTQLTERIGSSGELEHRSAQVAGSGDGRAAQTEDALDRPVQFTRAVSASEQLGIIAHHMRSRHLGLRGTDPLSWSEMAVVCRSRAEAVRVARGLAAQQIPTDVAAGGVVLGEHQIVRELVLLLRHALGFTALRASDVLQLIGGAVGGLDAVAIRRLRGSLLFQERRAAAAEAREPRSTDQVVLDAFGEPEAQPVVDSAAGRALRRIGVIAKEAAAVHAAGGTPRETLWSLWSGSKLADRWQNAALGPVGARAAEAHRSLDAALGLFFALQRHEESGSSQPIAELLDELLNSTVPQDSLASGGATSMVTVTTPQASLGQQFQFVAIVGLQDGAWPNTRPRGSLIGTTVLERWLGGGAAELPSRRETLHDELRLFAHSCARSRGELLVVSIANEEQHPSPFFRFGSDFLVSDLPSTRLTLRGVTAQMRRRISTDPTDSTALASLVALARAAVPGAHPEDWYGVRQPSSDRALFSELDESEKIPVSPSQLEAAEDCPLDWAIGALGGGKGNVQANIGTLVHHALECAASSEDHPDAGDERAAMLQAILADWEKLPFEADWESQRALRTAEGMVEGLQEFLRDSRASERILLANESVFSIPLDRAELRGTADRLEGVYRDGGLEVTVIDLKTGAAAASKADAEVHAQLLSYQLGVSRGAFEIGESNPALEVTTAGARLLYVHPDATRGSGYVERAQPAITEDETDSIIERAEAVSAVMASESFVARVEHHCSDPYRPGNCRVHIVQAVSFS